jgi:hypothetical protein
MTSIKPKLIALAVSIFFIAVLIGLSEVACRLFTRINFLDNSSGMFVYNRFGNTYGNTPNFTGISFGEEFRTDEYGFRIDDPMSKSGTDDAMLVMGDSVAFGPALKDADAIAGRLRRMMPGRRVHNAAVIGYDTFDHNAATSAIVQTHPEIRTVLLFLCLNDVSDASAQAIRANTPQSGEQPAASTSPIRRVNDYLRSRSKLYLWLKNLLVDTQMTYFTHDLAHYQKGDDNLRRAMQPVIELHQMLKEKGVDLKVFILPYEVQLRPGAPADHMLPQRMLTSYLSAEDVEHYDLTPGFARFTPRAGELFLYADPMHLSADGAKLVAENVCKTLPDCSP